MSMDPCFLILRSLLLVKILVIQLFFLRFNFACPRFKSAF
jgi:hypothetical protein